MDHFDDKPLDRAPQQDPLPTERRRPALAPILVIAAIGLLLGGLAAWWWTRTDRTPPPVVATNSSEAAVPVAEVPARTLPPLGQMDTFLRALLGALSSHPEFVRWLATDDLIRQMARGVDRISRGQSPAADVRVLRPTTDFSVQRRGTTMTIDPASYERYDRLADMMESLEARGVAEAYHTIQPRLDEAYRALGRSQTGVDHALDVAVQLLIDTPVPSEPIALVPGPGATFAFKDPELEQLAPIQKQLLRMGPDNMRRIQARLRVIRDELRNSANRTR